MKFGTALMLVGGVLLSGCIEMTEYPNDSPSRLLNEMRRPLSETGAVTIDPRDAHIAALEQELARLREQGNRMAVPVPTPAARVERSIVIVLRDEEFFATGSAKPTQDIIRTLRRTAEILKPHEAIITRIRVEGHTDDRRIHTKRFPSNKELSEARAQIIAWYLQRETGFPANLFSVTGHGASKPLASNATAEGRTRNRRVEIVITSHDGPAH